MDNVLAVGLLIGFVNVVKMQFPSLPSLASFLLSVVAGILLGYLHWYGVTSVEQGILLAFVASGAYKIATKAGGEVTRY